MPTAPARLRPALLSLLLLAPALALGGCAAGGALPDAPRDAAALAEAPPVEYRIGPLDQLTIDVWRAPEFSASVVVRPDGKISTPLLQDLQAAGKTPTELAADIKGQLTEYLQEPIVTVIVGGFSGEFDQQVRVVVPGGQALAVPYRAGMTSLDLMISVGGLTELADGNRAVLVRGPDSFRVRLDDLIRDGDISANVPIRPGDILIVPESFF